jgi:hypothetical protein
VKPESAAFPRKAHECLAKARIFIKWHRDVQRELARLTKGRATVRLRIARLPRPHVRSQGDSRLRNSSRLTVEQAQQAIATAERVRCARRGAARVAYMVVLPGETDHPENFDRLYTGALLGRHSVIQSEKAALGWLEDLGYAVKSTFDRNPVPTRPCVARAVMPPVFRAVRP